MAACISVGHAFLLSCIVSRPKPIPLHVVIHIPMFTAMAIFSAPPETQAETENQCIQKCVATCIRGGQVCRVPSKEG